MGATGDSYDQKMLWEEMVEKRYQLALVESEFHSRKSAELDKLAEILGTKRRVLGTQQERAFSDQKRSPHRRSRTRSAQFISIRLLGRSYHTSQAIEEQHTRTKKDQRHKR